MITEAGSHRWKLLLGAFAVLGACDGTAPRTVIGEHGAFADGQVFTWGDLDSNQRTREFGITVPIQSLAKINDGFLLKLALPAEVQATTPFKVALIEFKQRLILPAVYQVPRLDVRFFAVATTILQRIDCSNEPMPLSVAMPSPYVIQSTAAEPEGSCVPGIGVHAWNSSAAELAPDHHVTFEGTLLLGYHSGSVIFIDLIQPLEQAERAKAFEIVVPRPATIDASWQWPTNAIVVPNARATVLNFSLGRLQTGP